MDGTMQDGTNYGCAEMCPWPLQSGTVINTGNSPGTIASSSEELTPAPTSLATLPPATQVSQA